MQDEKVIPRRGDLVLLHETVKEVFSKKAPSFARFADRRFLVDDILKREGSPAFVCRIKLDDGLPSRESIKVRLGLDKSGGWIWMGKRIQEPLILVEKGEGMFCPDCGSRGRMIRTACVCLNKACKRHVVWGF